MSVIQVGLPDGKTLEVSAGSTVQSVAEQIGKGLARAALAGRIDGRLVDLRTPLDRDVSLQIVTARDPQGGEVIRHSAEHVMADAVKRLFEKLVGDNTKQVQGVITEILDMNLRNTAEVLQRLEEVLPATSPRVLV